MAFCGTGSADLLLKNLSLFLGGSGHNIRHIIPRSPALSFQNISFDLWALKPNSWNYSQATLAWYSGNLKETFSKISNLGWISLIARHFATLICIPPWQYFSLSATKDNFISIKLIIQFRNISTIRFVGSAVNWKSYPKFQEFERDVLLFVTCKYIKYPIIF